IANAVLWQPLFHLIGTELWVAAGSGMSADIDKHVDIVIIQGLQKHWNRAIPVANGPDLGFLAHFPEPLEILVSASPLCMATCAVLSLLISYCVSSGLHRRMCPLYSVSEVCFLTMVPETSPASEFQRTWSPTENVLLMALLLQPGYFLP